MAKRRRRGAPFYESTVVDGECLRWTACVNTYGYGLYVDPATKRAVMAHRWVYQQEVGPIPEGAHIDHVYKKGCRFRDCVKVEHLEPVTPKQNCERRVELITYCKWGHKFDEENTYITSRGYRQCKACHNRRNLESYYRSKAKSELSVR